MINSRAKTPEKIMTEKETFVSVYCHQEKEISSFVSAIGSKDEFNKIGIDFDLIVPEDNQLYEFSLFISKPTKTGFENQWFKIRLEE